MQLQPCCTLVADRRPWPTLSRSLPALHANQSFQWLFLLLLLLMQVKRRVSNLPGLWPERISPKHRWRKGLIVDCEDKNKPISAVQWCVTNGRVKFHHVVRLDGINGGANAENIEFIHYVWLTWSFFHWPHSSVENKTIFQTCTLVCRAEQQIHHHTNKVFSEQKRMLLHTCNGVCLCAQADYLDTVWMEYWNIACTPVC